MKVKASAPVDKSLWAEIKKLATLSDKPAGRIAEVGLKLLLIIAKTGVPDDLGALLQVHDPELLSTLRELYEAWRNASNI
ncbi:MAG: hypothetical protein QXH73_03750 [Ignisphaera sp.]